MRVGFLLFLLFVPITISHPSQVTLLSSQPETSSPPVSGWSACNLVFFPPACSHQWPSPYPRALTHGLPSSHPRASNTDLALSSHLSSNQRLIMSNANSSWKSNSQGTATTEVCRVCSSSYPICQTCLKYGRKSHANDTEKKLGCHDNPSYQVTEPKDPRAKQW
jgi:hypothetical protein